MPLHSNSIIIYFDQQNIVEMMVCGLQSMNLQDSNVFVLAVLEVWDYHAVKKPDIIYWKRRGLWKKKKKSQMTASTNCQTWESAILDTPIPAIRWLKPRITANKTSRKTILVINHRYVRSKKLCCFKPLPFSWLVIWQ